MPSGWRCRDARAGAKALSVFSRVGQVEDIAAVIAFFASNEARWTTGQMIDATGGARIRSISTLRELYSHSNRVR